VNLKSFKEACASEIQRHPKVSGAADQMYLSSELAQALELAQENTKRRPGLGSAGKAGLVWTFSQLDRHLMKLLFGDPCVFAAFT
jgi:hypothetical protein